jgi:hypothetical protein
LPFRTFYFVKQTNSTFASPVSNFKFMDLLQKVFNIDSTTNFAITLSTIVRDGTYVPHISYWIPVATVVIILFAHAAPNHSPNHKSCHFAFLLPFCGSSHKRKNFTRWLSISKVKQT